jgi:hypothetical protein
MSTSLKQNQKQMSPGAMPSSKRQTQTLGEPSAVAQTPPTYRPTQKDITRHEAYVIASIAASLFDKAIGPKGSVDQATEILRLSKEAAVHLNTPKKENRYLDFNEFAMKVTNDTNVTRAVRAFGELKFQNSFQSVVNGIARKESASIGKKITEKRLKEIRADILERKAEYLEGFLSSRYLESEISVWRDLYVQSMKYQLRTQ